MKAIVDCNSFYCSCERVFRPDLAKKPVVVLSNNDGCVISRTDEAKNLGVGMASPYYQNKDLIKKNGVAVFSSNYNLYGDLSMRVMDILRQLVGGDKVEVYSVDEAFLDLDVVPPAKLHDAAENIKAIIERWTGIEVSVGIAPTKVLAKLANRLSKKDKENTRGVMVLETEEKIMDALKRTAVEDIWGVGNRYATKLKQHWGVYDGWQLRNMNEEWARTNMGGVVGTRLIRELKGIPCIEMKDPLTTKKMITTTRMFGKPVTELKDLKEAVATYTSRAAEKLRRQFCAATSITVLVVTNNYKDYQYQYNPQTKNIHAKLLQPTSHTNELIVQATALVEKLYQPGSKYQKAGVVLGDLVPDDSIQGNIFKPGSANRSRLLMEAMDNINFSMRDDVVKYVASGLTRNWKMRQELKSKRYTTRWNELYEVS
jgi:DNA polymerase V